MRYLCRVPQDMVHDILDALKENIRRYHGLNIEFEIDYGLGVDLM
jgi:hypothetical protein